MSSLYIVFAMCTAGIFLVLSAMLLVRGIQKIRLCHGWIRVPANIQRYSKSRRAGIRWNFRGESVAATEKGVFSLAQSMPTHVLIDPHTPTKWVLDTWGKNGKLDLFLAVTLFVLAMASVSVGVMLLL